MFLISALINCLQQTHFYNSLVQSASCSRHFSRCASFILLFVMEIQLQIYLILGGFGIVICALILSNALLIYYVVKLFGKLSNQRYFIKTVYVSWPSTCLHFKKKHWALCNQRLRQPIGNESTRRTKQKIHSIHPRTNFATPQRKEKQQKFVKIAKVSFVYTVIN